MSTTATPHEAGRLYSTVVLFRVFWFTLFVFFVNAMVPLGTSPWLVSLCAGTGVIVASHLARSSLNWRAFALILAALWIASTLVFWTLDTVVGGLLPTSFGVDGFRLHVDTCLIVASIAAASTWMFWRVRVAITIETMALAALAILLFAGHRNFHFDRPKIINTIAWQLGIDHLTMLIAVGSFVLVAAVTYLVLASQASRPAADRTVVRRASTGRSWVLGAILLTLFGGAVYWIQTVLYNHFNSVMLARVSNGVGMGEDKGVSPLTFQSALGSTNQPAGLVRLEGDYKENPFSPMLYLRESALSQFNGHEMVFAGKAYDTDITATHPKEAYTGREDIDLLSRTPVVHSVYLLADHENAFAIDYPLSIVQLKNPKPGRFKNTYRAYSMAPAFSLAKLRTAPVGDPRWSADFTAHYLKPHTDPRYGELAAQLTDDSQTPVEKILAITTHLNANAIYTLTPNHKTEPKEDQVAPFLFGDLRGYCVHFAHAVTYMARSLGIPARIATGYLTDLSQAKDGHILLRMSDRHAWAEVYVAGFGWIPFDVQPENVESHADTQVDSKLLEELMGALDPGEEILPESTTKDEPGMTDPEEIWVPEMRDIKRVVFALLAAFILAKGALFFGWKIAHKPTRRLRWGYVSLCARLVDSGSARLFGETRSEYARRLNVSEVSDLTNLLNAATYSYGGEEEITSDRVNTALTKAHAAINKIPSWKRIVRALNPSSVFRTIGGGGW